MKGTMFQKPFEYNLITEGEEWKQGQKIKGKLHLKSHDVKSNSIDQINVMLTYGQFKKVKNKDKNAWEKIETIKLDENFQIDSQSEKEYEWSFDLKDDAPITDKSGSLYLIYGPGDDISQYGFLQLNVNMQDILEQYVQIFENFLRFRVSQKKFKKGYVELKLVPPKSKELNTIDSLLCSLKYNNKNIEAKYVFTIKTLGSEETGVKVQKKKKEFESILEPKQYEIYGSINHDGIKQSIDEIIKQAIPKLLY